jgi:hypothetical protein
MLCTNQTGKFKNGGTTDFYGGNKYKQRSFAQDKSNLLLKIFCPNVRHNSYSQITIKTKVLKVWSLGLTIEFLIKIKGVFIKKFSLRCFKLIKYYLQNIRTGLWYK